MRLQYAMRTPKLRLMQQQLMMLLCITGCCLRSASCAGTADCALYTRRSDGSTWLDCQPDAVSCCHGNTEYAGSRRLFVGIRRGDSLIHWELSPPLLGNQSINTLPPGAFRGLDDRLNSSIVLVLRRLHQSSLSLAALSTLPSLRHLVLTESNLTCLPDGAFASGIGGRLLSLDLLDNSGLACLQPGAFDGLRRLRSLRIEGSPRLLQLDAGAFNGLTGLVNLSLRLPPGAAAPESALSGLPATLSDLRLARGRQPADDTAALEFLPGLAGFVCARSPWLAVNGLPVGRLLADQLRSPMPAFCAEVAAADAAAAAAAASGAEDVGTGGEDPDVCGLVCPARAATSAMMTTTTPSTPPLPTTTPPARGGMVAVAAAAAGAGVGGHHERPNLTGTVLLMASAFAAGVLASLYCFLYRRRLGRLKPRSAALSVSAVAGTAVMAADEEPVRLVGYKCLSDGGWSLQGDGGRQLFIVDRAS